jgi:3-phenylpropionate/cinnamic acid dioxygenase small subunit
MDDDKLGLRRRLTKLGNPSAHSEVPPSRTRHQVSNVRVTRLANGEVDVRSNFSLFQSRREAAEFLFVGERHDRLRRVGADWQIARRTVVIDHNLLPRSLSVFF